MRQAPPLIEPMRPVLDRDALVELDRRLGAARLSAGSGESWAAGVPGVWLAELVADWRSFDTGALQARLDGLSHQRVSVDGFGVHAVCLPGRGPRPLPLLLTHGWPSSFLEYLDLAPLLTDPASHGGVAEDAFSVVLVSLPGFGFSDQPPVGGLRYAQVAELWHRLMADGLGVARYVAHGSDLGAGVTARLARAHPEAVAAIHLATPGLAAPPPPWSKSVVRHLEEVASWTAEEGGYAHEHATKPSTIGAALEDSPLALAAWMGEKLERWSSVERRDHLLATLTLYWATKTAASSLLPYYAFRQDPEGALPVDDPSPVPTAIDLFGGELVAFPRPSRELAERYFSVVEWAEHDRGGHFPAIAEPQLLAERLRTVFRPYRG